MKFLFLLLFSLPVFADYLPASAFPTANVKVGGIPLSVQVADTSALRMHGLMFVKTMAPDAGMLFVFEDEQTLSFWMKDTLIPLAIGFFDKNGILIDIQEMTLPESVLVKNPPSYQSSGPALYALEMNAGWFHKRHLKKGVSLQLVGSTKSALLKQKLGH